MPYSKNSDLPESVQRVLPDLAQDVYREAFNKAFQEYADPGKRQGGTVEETAHAVAWDAVENKYEKDESGNWVRKGREE
jgi:cation transport regulator